MAGPDKGGRPSSRLLCSLLTCPSSLFTPPSSLFTLPSLSLVFSPPYSSPDRWFRFSRLGGWFGQKPLVASSAETERETACALGKIGRHGRQCWTSLESTGSLSTTVSPKRTTCSGSGNPYYNVGTPRCLFVLRLTVKAVFSAALWPSETLPPTKRQRLKLNSWAARTILQVAGLRKTDDEDLGVFWRRMSRTGRTKMARHDGTRTW